MIKLLSRKPTALRLVNPSARSEERFSRNAETDLVCRLLLEKKNHQLTILSNTDALDEEKWLNMLGTFVKDWFRYESHFVHGRDSLVDILKERGLLSESDAVQPQIYTLSLHDALPI